MQSPPQKQVKNPDKGFTLVEIMVAMVVLAIGLLGMAAMTVLVMRGNKGADQITIATSLATQKMEALKDRGYENLGTADDTSDVNYHDYGVTGNVFTGPSPAEPMNALGETTASPGPEYMYWRMFAICDYVDTGVGDAPFCTAGVCDERLCTLLAGDSLGVGDMAAGDTGKTPVELACDVNSAKENEKRIRVVTYWLDRFGACHRVAMDTIVVNLQGGGS